MRMPELADGLNWAVTLIGSYAFRVHLCRDNGLDILSDRFDHDPAAESIALAAQDMLNRRRRAEDLSRQLGIKVVAE